MAGPGRPIQLLGVGVLLLKGNNRQAAGHHPQEYLHHLENLATDDGSQFRAHIIEDFLTRWGVEHKISADYNPHSNLRAETGVKTAKRLLLTRTHSI